MCAIAATWEPRCRILHLRAAGREGDGFGGGRETRIICAAPQLSAGPAASESEEKKVREGGEGAAKLAAAASCV
jgi:hypothetical protein